MTNAISDTLLLIISLLALTIPAILTHKRALFLQLVKIVYYLGASSLCIYSLFLLGSSSVEVLTTTPTSAYSTTRSRLDHWTLSTYFAAAQKFSMFSPSLTTMFLFLVCCFLLYLQWHST